MSAINTVKRPLRPAAAPSTLRPEHFRYLALQAEIMAERRCARAFSSAALRELADVCRAKARHMTVRVS